MSNNGGNQQWTGGEGGSDGWWEVVLSQWSCWLHWILLRRPWDSFQPMFLATKWMLYGYFWRDVGASPAVFAVTKPSIWIHNRSFSWLFPCVNKLNQTIKSIASLFSWTLTGRLCVSASAASHLWACRRCIDVWGQINTNRSAKYEANNVEIQSAFCLNTPQSWLSCYRWQQYHSWTWSRPNWTPHPAVMLAVVSCEVTLLML